MSWRDRRLGQLKISLYTRPSLHQNIVLAHEEGQNMFAELEEHERLVQMKENSLAFDPATKKSKRNPTQTTGPNATTSTENLIPAELDVAMILLELKKSVEHI